MLVWLNSRGYSYDVHSLVKAFFPDREVKITEDGNGDDCDIKVFVSSGDVKDGERVSGFVKVSGTRENAVITQEANYDDLDRPEVKSVMKRALYSLLCRITGTDLPWGTMTGIRPVKVARGLLSKGKSDDEICSYMKKQYLCSDEKTLLACSIAHREQEIIDNVKPGSFGLYVGIPFCPTTCLYCSFTSFPYASWKDKTGLYLETVKRELDLFSGYYAGRCANSVYIGGGTPTTLSPDELFGLIGYIRSHFELAPSCEITVEAGRPDSITKEKLEALNRSGVTRISINPQTMNDKTLRLIGRMHTTDDVYKAYGLARDAGFTNINMDLIIGLPGEDIKDVGYTFEKIKKLASDSLTVHSLAIKRAAAMTGYVKEHGGIPAAKAEGMMDIARKAADDMGLLPYYLYRQKNIAGNLENIGFARPGCFGIYNTVIMEEVSDIAACGAGTISKRIFDDGRIERCDNVKDVGQYIDRIDEMLDRKRKLFSDAQNK